MNPVKDPNPCRVIGVLDDGVASLGATALAHLRTADVVIGGARTLALLRHEFKPQARLHDLGGQLKAARLVQCERRVGARVGQVRHFDRPQIVILERVHTDH